MFTGLIEEVGVIEAVGTKLKIRAAKVLEDIHIGDSICVNGACLTVVGIGKGSFTADVMPETLRCSNLGELKKGSRVNLERAMPANGRFGGHIVSGHVDGVGIITDIRQDGIAKVFTVAAESGVLRYIINKGSITIDGISLTVCHIDERCFAVSIIPHTQQETTLTYKRSGDKVNLETDIIAGYVEKLLEKPQESRLSMEFLKKCGF